MRHLVTTHSLALLLLLTAPAAGGVSGPSAAELRGSALEEPAVLRVKEQPLPAVFQLLGRLSGITFTLADGLHHEVSFNLEAASLREVLELIERTQALVYRQEGATVFVRPVAHQPCGGPRR